MEEEMVEETVFPGLEEKCEVFLFLGGKNETRH